MMGDSAHIPPTTVKPVEEQSSPSIETTEQVIGFAKEVQVKNDMIASPAFDDAIDEMEQVC